MGALPVDVPGVGSSDVFISSANVRPFLREFVMRRAGVQGKGGGQRDQAQSADEHHHHQHRLRGSVELRCDAGGEPDGRQR